jgi:PAS domain S-box-containing protein
MLLGRHLHKLTDSLSLYMTDLRAPQAGPGMTASWGPHIGAIPIASACAYAAAPEPICRRRKLSHSFEQPSPRRFKAQAAARSAFVFLALCCLLQHIAGAQSKPIRRILILNEVGPSFPLISAIEQGIRTALDNSPYKLEFYHEYLETTLFPDAADQKAFRDFYLRKYERRIPDVIVTVGPSPLQFMVETHQRFFPSVPIVFCLPNSLSATVPVTDSDFTGVETDWAVAETLRAALRLQPATEHVVVVGGVAVYDRQREEIVRRQLAPYANHLDILYLTELAMPDLLERLKHLPTHTVVLMTAIGRDAAGTRFSSSETGPMISAAADAPVFSLADNYLGHGEVGGVLSDLTQQGKAAGAIALRILQGEKPRDIPRVRIANENKFDWRALQRWGFKESNLPPGSTLINRPPSFFQLYGRYVLPGLFLLIVQSLAILALLWQRAKRRQIAAELLWRLEFESLLSELSTTFINLPEEQIDGEIARSLARLGESLKMDSISLLEFSPDRKELGTICSWSAPGVLSAPPVLKTDQLPWWKKRLLRGEVTVASDSDSLPEGALAERQYFRQTGITCAASVPLEVGGEVNGAISFVSLRRQLLWSDDLISQLRVTGEIFWSALKRKRAAKELFRSQATLRESEERFRLVSNTAPVMIWMSNPNKLYTYFNAPWLQFTGRTLGEELTNGWAQGVHPDDLEKCWETYSKSFDQREAFQMEYRLRRFDEEYRWVFDQGVPRFNADGSFAGYIGSCIDVTERKAAEEALSSIGRKLIEAHEEERTWIARELHDDFNQRITLLAVNLVGLKKALRNGQLSRALQEAIKEVGELGRDIQELAHRLHSSKLEYLGLVAACAGFCRELSDRHKIEIAFHSEDVPKKLPQEIALCLFRILQEALQNAVKHSGVQHFEVSLIGGSSEIHLTIRDSGIGFDPAEAIMGPGLGLTSMKERLKLVDGELSLESQLQHGTTINARVPLHLKAASAKAAG